MDNSEFENTEASLIGEDKKYDLVVSHSVFHYFKNLEYAKTVIIKMIKKSTKKIAILDINDKSKEYEYHKIRMASMNKDEYKNKYNGLEHMFYDKNWFKKIAKEFNMKIYIFDQAFENYSNSSLRFNVIMTKND
jgi:hypothetical protein